MSENDANDAVLPDVMRQRGCSVTGLLGAGGMGRVYAVADPRLDRTIALKIARGQAGSFAWKRLRREARITAGLGGGVVAVHEVGELPDGRPWFSMSLAEGRALSEVLDEPMSPEQRIAVVHRLVEVCALLAPIHDAGVVHRDLKPANIWLGQQATILDWGLARVLSTVSEEADPAVEQTREGARLGTPSRMSPEQAAGIAVDARADVWALGVLLWEVLAGETAYPGERAPAVISRVLQGPPSMEPVAWAGPALVGVIAGALSPLAERTPDAGALHEALQAALAPPRRRALGWPLAGAGLLLLLGGALSAAMRPEPAAPTEPTSEPTSELVASLTAAARDAARSGRRHQAELLATDALEAGGEAALRGLLLSPRPRPILELDVAMPGCEIGEMISPDGSLLACANPGYTTGYGIDEDGVSLRWRQDVEIHQFQFSGLDTVLGQVPEQSILTVLDGKHGGPIGYSNRFSTGRLMPSRSPDRMMHLKGTARAVERKLTERIYRYDERTAPCPTGLAAILEDGSELHACPGELLHLDVETLAVRSRWPLRTAESRVERMILDTTGEHVALLLHSDHHAVVDIDGEIRWAEERLPRAGSIAISPGGRYVALGTILECWIFDREQPERTWRIPGRGKSLVFDVQGRLILQGDDRIQRWRIPEPSESAWAVGSRIQELDWGASGLLARRVDGAVVRWPDSAVVAPQAEVVAVSAHHDSVAVGLPGGAVQIIGQPPIPVDEPCRSLEWLDEDTLVCAPAGPGPFLIDTRTRTVDGGVGLPASSWFAAASQGRGRVALLEWSGSVFHLGGTPLRLTRSESASWANTLSLSPDGTTVALGGSWGVGLMDLATDTLTTRLELPRRVCRVVYSPDGRWLAATSYEGDLYLYRDGALASHTILSASQTLLLAFSPDSQRLALGGTTGIAELIDLSQLDRPLESVIAEVRAAWGAVD